jgi:hypothetical protein
VAIHLTGFNTFRRSVSISCEFTATVDGEMAVGALEETITVTGEAPLVDTRRRGQTHPPTPCSRPER